MADYSGAYEGQPDRRQTIRAAAGYAENDNAANYDEQRSNEEALAVLRARMAGESVVRKGRASGAVASGAINLLTELGADLQEMDDQIQSLVSSLRPVLGPPRAIGEDDMTSPAPEEESQLMGILRDRRSYVRRLTNDIRYISTMLEL